MASLLVQLAKSVRARRGPVSALKVEKGCMRLRMKTETWLLGSDRLIPIPVAFYAYGIPANYGNCTVNSGSGFNAAYLPPNDCNSARCSWR